MLLNKGFNYFIHQETFCTFTCHNDMPTLHFFKPANDSWIIHTKLPTNRSMISG